MPPVTSNDNQGLKIAVGILAGLAVVLAVTTYLGFSENDKSNAKLAAAEKAKSDSVAAQNLIQKDYDDLRETVGVGKVDMAATKDEIAKQVKALTEQVQRITEESKKYVAEATDQGGSVQKALEELVTSSDTFVNSEPKSLLNGLNLMGKILQNHANLLVAEAGGYQGTRKELEGANVANQAKLKVEEEAKITAQNDAQAELAKHDEARKALNSQNADLQTRNQQLANDVNALKAQLAQLQEESQKKISNLLAQVRVLREQAEATDTLLEKANGYITYVDNQRDEVRTTLKRSDGATEQMVFSVFDKEAPGVPSDKPKATIQLVRVDSQGSIGRILKRLDELSPLRQGDQVYSPAFSANRRSFALIGKIDMDRDGSDDREDLKRMIRAAGGKIDFDLPPPGVGVKSGQLSSLTSWYVLDNSQPLRPGTERDYGATAEELQAFEKDRTAALSEARASGVRPIDLDRLKAMLNFTYGAPAIGQREGLNRKAVERIINPRGTVPGVPQPGAGGAANGNEPTTPPANDPGTPKNDVVR